MQKVLNFADSPNPVSQNGENKMAKDTTQLESWEQTKIFNWINENKGKYPALNLYFATGNGLKLTPGQSKKAKAQGILEKGIPDIIGDFPFNGYHGQRIELKRLKGSKTSAEQTARIWMYNSLGFKADVIKGADNAIEAIKKYLGIME